MGDILTNAMRSEAAWEASVRDMGYTRKTTFWSDFTIADAYGEDAIKDTLKRSLDWLSNVEYGTELVMVLNHKCWEWYKKDEKRSHLYADLFEKTYDALREKHKGNDEAMSYIWQTLD